MATDMLYALLGAAGCSGLCTMFFLQRKISQNKVTHSKAAKIAQAIRLGAMTFLKEEYKIISLVALSVAALLGYAVSLDMAGVFLLSCSLSMLAGFIGMSAATKANVNTTVAAQNDGEQAALVTAFFGGGIMGFAVASFGLLGLLFVMHMYAQHEAISQILTAFAAGISLVAFFARVGGGIYTKSADVGADLVGKIEAGIPEDDPRNPAVIADNVGDCVGDTAGMGADIFESYVGTMISCILLALSYRMEQKYIMLPMILSGIGLVASIASIFIAPILHRSLNISSAALLRLASSFAIVLCMLGTFVYMVYADFSIHYFITCVIGCFSGVSIGMITEYYTGGQPVRDIAASSQSGAGTNVIRGLSVGMESTVLPILLLSGSILLSYYSTGMYGISLAAVAMLATVAITLSVDAYGPIADNAGGIAEMAGFDKSVRVITDKLDALGNTTAAVGKGFAIGSALMATIALFSAFAQAAHITVINVLTPEVLIGAFVGGIVPFFVSALTMRSVGDAAMLMVLEVRRQFASIPGLMEGTAEPNYARCISIATQASLQQMILPGLVGIFVPVLVKYTLGIEALGGMLVGSTLTGVLLALMMANGGGAWDNAKKYIESGHFGGKGSATHMAAVIGDIVGDPFKDTSGPALNILIKLMAIVSLLLVA